MSPAADRFPRVERLDAEDMARALFEQTQVRLTVEGPCAGGQVGTSYVRWPDGHPGVLKWRPHITVQELRDGPLAVAGRLRRVGYPAPATELTAQVGHAVVMVQEVLPGAKIDHLDAHHFDRVTQVHRLQSNALEGRGDTPPPTSSTCARTAPATASTSPSASSAAAPPCSNAGSPNTGRIPPATFPATTPCTDLHSGNILCADGTITGVVDWDGAARGDHRFGLVVLRFGVHPAGADREVIESLDTLLDDLPDEILLPAWAHMSLRMTDWAIRDWGRGRREPGPGAGAGAAGPRPG